MKIKGDWKNRRVWIDGRELSPLKSQRIVNHSPDGFSWGYGGSGPAQLAIAILMEMFGGHFGYQHYQSFKWFFVSHLPQADFEIDFDIKSWRIKEEWDFPANK